MKKGNSNIRNGLSPYIPEESLDDLCMLIAENPFYLIITRPRKTKRGDFKPNVRGRAHRISVNGNLNRYAFLITLLHEIAHLIVWNKWGAEVKPHGSEWKSTFTLLLKPYVQKKIFPSDLFQALHNYLQNPKASSCSDLNLERQLRKYDDQTAITVEDIPDGTVFLFRGKEYRKIRKRRTRFECELTTNNKLYLFNALAQIELTVPS